MSPYFFLPFFLPLSIIFYSSPLSLLPWVGKANPTLLYKGSFPKLWGFKLSLTSFSLLTGVLPKPSFFSQKKPFQSNLLVHVGLNWGWIWWISFNTDQFSAHFGYGNKWQPLTCMMGQTLGKALTPGRLWYSWRMMSLSEMPNGEGRTRVSLAPSLVFWGFLGLGFGFGFFLFFWEEVGLFCVFL